MVRMMKYRCYVQVVKGKIYVCRILHDGKPALDPNECYNFSELHMPPSQGFLDSVNRTFRTSFKMADFVEEEVDVENIPDTSGLLWEQKNRKEMGR